MKLGEGPELTFADNEKRTGNGKRKVRCCFGATPLVGELPRSNGWRATP
jgi:hypothetical protein